METPTAPDPSFEPEGLRRLARGLLGDADRADDAVQEAWIVALEKGRRGPSRWWRGVVARRAMHRRRTDARRGKYERAVRPEEAGGDVASHVEALDEQRRALAALRALDEPYRRILWLHFFGGHAPTAIAGLLSMPAATVRTHLHRGLARLRAALSERDGGGDRWKGRLAAFVALPGLRIPEPVARRIGWGRWVVAGGLGAASIAVGLVGLAPGGGGEGPELRSEVPAAGAAAAEPLAVRPRAPATVPPPQGAHVLRGIVVAPGGVSPRGGFVYAVRKVRPRGDASDPVAFERLGADGAFELALAEPEAHWLLVTPPAGAPWSRCVLDGADVRAVGTLRVEPEPAVELRGRVVDARGEAVTDSTVEVLAVEAGAVRAWPGPDDPLLGAGAPVRVAGGEFSATLADPLPRRLRVRAPGYGDAEVIVPRASEPVLVVLRTSAVVAIELEGVPSAQVVARLERVPEGDAEPYAMPAPVLRGDPLRFEDGIAPGAYRLELSGEGVRPRRLAVRVPTAASTVVVRAVLAPGAASARLRVQAVGLRQAPPTELTRPGALVLVRDPDRDGGRWRRVVPEVGDDGSLRILELLDGETAVLVVDRGGAILAARANLALLPGRETSISTSPVPATWVHAPAPREPGEPSVVAGGVEWPLYRWDGLGAALEDGSRGWVEGALLGPYPRGAAAPRLRVRAADGTVVEHELEEAAPSGAPQEAR